MVGRLVSLLPTLHKGVEKKNNNKKENKAAEC